MLATTEVRDAVAGDFGGMAMVYRRASLSNEGDRSLLLLHPECLDLSADAVLAGRSLVAVVEGRVVGFASVVAVEDGLELEALFVDPDWMRRRVGSALVDAVVVRAGRNGRSMITVSANWHALAFYEQAGFVEVGMVELESGATPAWRCRCRPAATPARNRRRERGRELGRALAAATRRCRTRTTGIIPVVSGHSASCVFGAHCVLFDPTARSIGLPAFACTRAASGPM